MRMQDYEYIFCKSLHEALKKIIIGHIYVEIQENCLFVNIQTRDGIDWNYRYSGIDHIIVENYGNTSDLVKDIVREYKGFVISQLSHRYFY